MDWTHEYKHKSSASTVFCCPMFKTCQEKMNFAAEHNTAIGRLPPEVLFSNAELPPQYLDLLVKMKSMKMESKGFRGWILKNWVEAMGSQVKKWSKNVAKAESAHVHLLEETKESLITMGIMRKEDVHLNMSVKRSLPASKSL